MKVSGRVTATDIQDGKMYMTCQMDGRLPNVGEHLTVRWGRQRTGEQNALYWVWLTWLFDNGAKNEGYVSAEELHEAFKGRFLAETKIGHNGMKYQRIKSTTELNAHEFTEYIDRCGDAVRDYLKIDDAQFWVEYHNEHSNTE